MSPLRALGARLFLLVLSTLALLPRGADAAPSLGAVLAATDGEPVLLVGDSPGLAGRGVAINFFLKPDILGDGHRLRFQIDPSVLKGRGLKVMSDLYDVGEVVR
jgi:hypothetical protein